MALEIQRLNVRKVIAGAQTDFIAGSLHVCAEELVRMLSAADERVRQVNVDLANAGDATRIVCVKDVVEPRLRISGAGPAAGAIRVLTGAAVVTCGPIVGYQEGIIDMSGPGADFTPFSDKQLVVLNIEVVDGLSQHEHEETVRRAGLRAAEYLAGTGKDVQPDETETAVWDDAPVNDQLPHIAYVYMVLSQGLLHDTYVLGENARQGLPRSVDPRIGMIGEIVSGNCVSACDKNTTYFHQNNPVIAELLHGHGRQWNLAGVVVTNEPTRLADKQASARSTIELVRQLNAEGAIVTKEGFGNPDTDQMMIVAGLEAAGIRTTMITDEFAGIDGDSQSLADTTPAADAVVSVGNANGRIILPTMDRVIGPLPDVSRLAGGYPASLRDDGSLEVELQAVIGATNALGIGYLTCREV